MSVKINGGMVGPGYPCFVVAEIGINHNGSLEMALQLIQAAAQAGANAVKFQKRTVNIVYSKEELNTPRVFDRSIVSNALKRCEIEGVHYEVFPGDSLARVMNPESELTNGDLKNALEFGLKEFDTINRLCKELNINWSASTWDGLSAEFINGFPGVHWLKIASACLTHRDLLVRARNSEKPIFLSTGGSTIEQIQKAVGVLGTNDLVLLHCVAEYPPPDEDTNLLVMETLRRMYPGVPVGYSSHSVDTLPPVIAVAMGASVIEAHLTLDKDLPGSDHKASLTPDQFGQMVRDIRRVERMRGNGVKVVLPGEFGVMKKLRRIDDL